MLSLPGAHVELTFGEAVMSWDVSCRKKLARSMRSEAVANIQRPHEAPAEGADPRALRPVSGSMSPSKEVAGVTH